MAKINTLDHFVEIGQNIPSFTAKRVAITGGIACGKSALASFLLEMGCDIIDADDLVHRLEGPGGRAVTPITAAFGRSLLAPDGSIDRSVLGPLVFGNPDKLQVLNEIIHPMVRLELDDWFRQRENPLSFAVIPLLFEAGWHEQWDYIVCVACRGGTQLQRLCKRGLSEKAAQLRIAAQWPIEKKAAMANRVIWNDGTKEMLRREAEQLVKDLAEINYE